jgi:hypothetical protein
VSLPSRAQELSADLAFLALCRRHSCLFSRFSNDSSAYAKGSSKAKGRSIRLVCYSNGSVQPFDLHLPDQKPFLSIQAVLLRSKYDTHILESDYRGSINGVCRSCDSTAIAMGMKKKKRERKKRGGLSRPGTDPT